MVGPPLVVYQEKIGLPLMVVLILASRTIRGRIVSCDNRNPHFLRKVHKGAKLA